MTEEWRRKKQEIYDSSSSNALLVLSSLDYLQLPRCFRLCNVHVDLQSSLPLSENASHPTHCLRLRGKFSFSFTAGHFTSNLLHISSLLRFYPIFICGSPESTWSACAKVRHCVLWSTQLCRPHRLAKFKIREIYPHIRNSSHVHKVEFLLLSKRSYTSARFSLSGGYWIVFYPGRLDYFFW